MFKKDFFIRSIKLVDISYITIIYFILAYYLAGVSDYVFVKIFGNNYEKMDKRILIIQCLLQIIAIGIISYFVRNLVELVPFPLNGWYGYDHLLLKELSEPSGIFTVLFFFFQYHLQDKLTYLAKKDTLIKDITNNVMTF